MTERLEYESEIAVSIRFESVHADDAFDTLQPLNDLEFTLQSGHVVLARIFGVKRFDHDRQFVGNANCRIDRSQMRSVDRHPDLIPCYRHHGVAHPGLWPPQSAVEHFLNP